MADIFAIQVSPGRVIRVQADTPEQAAAGARKVLENESAGFSDNVAQSFGQGATMNFGDEATAAVRAAAPDFANWMMRGPALQRDESIGGPAPTPQTVSSAPTFEGRYDEELQRERDKRRQFEATNPKTATAANIAGNVASTVAALPAVVTAAAPTMLGNIIKMSATGAALGGASGFGEGEGQSDRIAKLLLGAGVGGATGGAAPLLGAAARAALETSWGRAVSEKVAAPAIRAVASAFGQQTPGKSLSAAAADGGAYLPPSGLQGLADRASNVAETGAVDRIATALQRAKLNPAQVERRLGQLGDEAMLADVDPQFLSMARGAKIMPGATRSHADVVLTSRDRGAGNRLVSAFEGSEPPPSSFALRGEGQAFDQNLRAVGSHAYGMMDEAGLRQTPELMALYENPHVAAAIDRVMAAEKVTRAGTTRAPASPVEIMHKVKQEIWDLGFNKDTARPGPMASWYRDLGIQYMDRLKAANPMLAEADRRYAQAASLPEHFDAGRAFLTRGSSEKATDASAPAIADLLARADPQQAIAARAGATNAARETALEGTRPARALAQRIDESTPVRDKIVQLFGSQQGNGILQRAASEVQFAKTSNEMLRGSQTAEKTVDALDLGGTKIRLGPSGASGGVVERLGQLITKMTGPNEAVRDAIGRATLNPNSEESRRLLALAAEVLKRRAQGAPVSASAAEIAASLAGRD